MSSWSSTSSFPYRKGNLSFQSADLTVEFNRTKLFKIFKHKLGEFNFSQKDVNVYRQKAIDESPLYSVSSVYLGQRLINPSSNGTYVILAHGATSQKVTRENCSAVKMTCLAGQGTGISCKPGKCVSGRLSRVSEVKSDGTVRVSSYKWMFTSTDSSNAPYYVLQQDGLITLDHSRTGTSRHTKLYVPPNSYLQEKTFVRDLYKNFSYYVLIGGEDKKDKFIAEGVKQSSYYNPERIPVEDLLLRDISPLGEPWYSLAEAEVNKSRSLYIYDQDFLGDIYDRLSSLFSKAIQVTPSSLLQGNIDYSKEDISRPIYSRLPSTSGTYNSIDNEETVSKWVVSGADELLSKSQSRIANFHRDYLDPDTCYPLALDWLAQHIGMFGPLWDASWPESVKRGVIKNAFGWWDRNVDGENHKSKILKEAPFVTSSLWTSNPEDIDGSSRLNLAEIESFKVDPTTREISFEGKYTVNTVTTSQSGVSTLTTSKTNDPKYLSSEWNGMIESKGGILTVVFLISLFGLKSHIPTELKIIDLEKGLLKPKTGLRSVEIDAPPLLPFKQETSRVGNDDDLRVGNYANQLVVGVSRINDVESTRHVIFRVPYYYNRGGRSWSKVEYIVNNWMPANVNARVQYPYLSADLWSVGDAFFEPEYVVES